MERSRQSTPPVVITGIGLIASTGSHREAVWRSVRSGRSGMRFLTGLEGIPDGLLVGAPVLNIEPIPQGRLKSIALAEIAAAEALDDSGIDLDAVDLDRFGAAFSGHMGDTGWVNEQCGSPRDPSHVPWHDQWYPFTGCSLIAGRYGLRGRRICHSVACSSGMMDFLAAVNTIREGRADLMLAGAGEAIHPLFAAGFQQMRVLAHHDDPAQACRPFDARRSGFVMGEGGAVMVLERLDHALARGAKIYAEFLGGKALSDAHHVTGIDAEHSSLAQAISITLRKGHIKPEDIGYINAHGTGTLQNDPVEISAIRTALGEAAEQAWVSSTKSTLGHLVNAAGIMELAITTLALRDGFAPPTINLVEPDPQCDLDCLPQKGRPRKFQTALKLSVAFGGHIVAVALRRWNSATSGFAYPEIVAA